LLFLLALCASSPGFASTGSNGLSAEDATVWSYTKWGYDVQCLEAERSYIYKLTDSSTG